MHNRLHQNGAARRRPCAPCDAPRDLGRQRARLLRATVMGEASVFHPKHPNLRSRAASCSSPTSPATPPPCPGWSSSTPTTSSLSPGRCGARPWASASSLGDRSRTHRAASHHPHGAGHGGHAPGADAGHGPALPALPRPLDGAARGRAGEAALHASAWRGPGPGRRRGSTRDEFVLTPWSRPAGYDVITP